LKTRLSNLRKRLLLVQEQVKISENLLKEDLTNRYKHLDHLKEVNSLESSISENQSMLLKADSALKQAIVQKSTISNTYLEEVRDHLKTTRMQYNEYQQRLRKSNDSLDRTILRAPVDGIVKSLYVSTEGGVIRPGGSVLDLVPSDVKLVIEAKLPTRDIGYVQEGQKANVSLASSDAQRFGKLEGMVISISPDTLLSQNGIPYYKVQLITKQDHFKDDKQLYKLVPGMSLTVQIIIGQRSVLKYLTEPFLSRFGSALKER